MALPSNPDVGDQGTLGDTVYEWDGEKWSILRDTVEADEPAVPYAFLNPLGSAGKSIWCGDFWSTGVDLGQFWWEAWVCPLNGSGTGEYWLSEGYGGAHAVLMSPINGNVWDGISLTSFSSDYTPETGEWLYSAVSWDGTNIRTYVNGVVCNVTAFAGPRRAQQGGLYVGGSDHSNLHGKIAAVRGFETADGSTAVLPYYVHSNGLAYPYTPVKSVVDYDPRAATAVRAQFALDLTYPALVAHDLSAGFGGVTHNGTFTGPDGSELLWAARPAGYFVADPTCPLRLDQLTLPVRTVPTAPSTPVGAKIFDSFSRADALNCIGTATLGSTEAGSLGVKVWGGDLCWGVFDGRAVEQIAGGGVITWVTNNSADMDVRIDRRRVAGLHHTGLAFRVTSSASCWKASTTGTLASGTVKVTRPGGTDMGDYTHPGSGWTTIRIVASGTTITCYVDNGSGGWTQLGQGTSETANQSSTGAGIYSPSPPSTAKRWDNFTVL